MNDDAQLIKAALDRRFARAATPPCPSGPWRAAATAPAALARPRPVFRGFAYAAVLLVGVAIAGVAAQASGAIRLTYPSFLNGFFVSSKPLMPGIHAADRLTIAQAQRRMSFSIVEPVGLPANTRFLYAHTLTKNGIPQVALNYQAHVGSRYYRIVIGESAVAVGPASAHFELRTAGSGTKTWTLPVRRWKHGAVVMDMFAWGLPSDMSDHIVQANTM